MASTPDAGHVGTLDALRSAGHPIDLLTAEQQEVFASLSPDEVRTLNDIKERLDAVAPEVEGHNFKAL